MFIKVVWVRACYNFSGFTCVQLQFGAGQTRKVRKNIPTNPGVGLSEKGCLR